MKVKKFFKKVFLTLVVTTLALTVCSCGGCSLNKKVKVEIMTEERTNKVSHKVETVELGEGGHYQLIDIISIDKDTVTYTFNLDEVTAKYGDTKTFSIVAYDHGTYTYEVKISKD